MTNLEQQQSLTRILIGMANIPIEQTMKQLERIAGKTTKEMSEKTLDREDSKLKYLLHKYAYEDETTQKTNDENLRALKRPKLLRPKNKFNFPYSKPSRSFFPEIPYDKGQKYKSILKHTYVRDSHLIDHHNSSNFSSVSQIHPNSQRFPSLKSKPWQHQVKSAEVSVNHLPEDSSRLSIRSLEGRDRLYKLLDGTSYLQARPGVKLPQLKTNRKKASPYI